MMNLLMKKQIKILMTFLLMSIPTSAFAVTDCESEIQQGFSSASNSFTSYNHMGLKIFYFAFRMLNKGFANIPKAPICHFINDMGFLPKKDALPFDSGAKTFTDQNGNSISVRLTVESPTESFAISAGYDAKAIVTVNGSNFMYLFWGGKGEDSKGYMIHAATGFDATKKSPMYLLWDRTGESQVVKVFSARYVSSYLGAAGDSALFGRASYNKTTGAISAQSVMMYRDASATQCFKFIGSGTQGSSLTIAFPTSGPITSTDANFGATGSAGMSTESVTDSTATSSGTAGTFSGSFDYSCNQVNTSTTVFTNGDVSFSSSPSSIFPN